MLSDIEKILSLLPAPLSVLIAFYITFKICNLGSFSTKEKNPQIKEPISYYRDIPTTNLALALWIGIKYNLIKDKYDFLGVMLLKWLKEGKIQLRKNNKKIYIDFSNHFKTDDDYERDFYHLFLSVSGINHYLEEHEFISYILYNPKIVDNIYKSTLNNIENSLLEQGLIKKSNTTLIRHSIIDEKIEEIANNMAGLKKFLEDFSVIETRTIEEIVLWEYYLIYAQAFGIATEIQNQFQKLYPNQEKINNLNLADSTIISTLILSIKIGISN